MTDTIATIKPGYKTTEFYVTLLTSVSGVIALFTDKFNIGENTINTIAAIAAVVIPQIVYVFSRASVKKNA